ncbi:MAG: hypothetical protein JOZ73_06040 [Solirubrobacterales bacterium]|nr:hypothetical protein [Solirubrobacterales bacterium]
MIQADEALLERARHLTSDRGSTFPQLVRDALERELERDPDGAAVLSQRGRYRRPRRRAGVPARRVALILDTGPLVALIDRDDPDHQRCARLLTATRERRVVPVCVLVEASTCCGRGATAPRR